MLHSLIDAEQKITNEKQRSSQRKYREHLSNLPSHHDNATHQGISINQPCYEERCMEWEHSQPELYLPDGAQDAEVHQYQGIFISL